MSNLYTAEATATGGRSGHASSSDGQLDLNLVAPPELGGPGTSGTNPEQLFAVGYAACFQGALGVIARRQKIELDPQNTITARIGLEKSGLGFKLNAELQGRFPGLERAEAERLMHAAHEVCPYSAATRGNIEVKLTVLD